MSDPSYPNSGRTSFVNSYFSAKGLGEAESGAAVPPDVQIAAGPTTEIEIVHYMLMMYDKSGNRIAGESIYTFFGFTGSGIVHHPYDLQALYDPNSRTYFVAILDTPGAPPGPTSYIVVAVLPASPVTFTPTKVYSIPASNGAGLDRDTMGISDDKLTITADAGGVIAYWILNKSALTNSLSVDCSSGVNCYWGTLNYGGKRNLLPVISLSSTTTQYLVGLNTGTSPNTVEFWCVGSSPCSSTTKPVLVTSFPISNLGATQWAPQPGTTEKIRIDPAGFVFSAVWFKNLLYLASEDGCGNPTLTCIHLTELHTAGMLVEQDFDFSLGGLYLFRPALSMDGTGDLALVFGYSSPNDYPSVGVIGQAYWDSPDVTTNSWVPLVTGSAPHLWIDCISRDGSGSCTAWGDCPNPDLSSCDKRFGDYFSAAVDPSDNSLIWLAGVYYSQAASTCVLGSGQNIQEPCWLTSISAVRVGGLDMTVSPANQAVPGGYSSSYTVIVDRLGGFRGVVNLGTNWISVVTPSYPSLSITPSAIDLSQSSYGYATVSESSSTLIDSGQYVFYVVVSYLTDGLVVYANMTAVPPLVCSASASPTSGKYSVTVQFSASCSSGTPKFSYSWQFNDGTGATSTLQNPTYTYSYDGPNGHTFYPTLTVTDAAGLTVSPGVPAITVTTYTCRNICPVSPLPSS